MPRKPDPEAQYRISVHIDKGYRYASTQPAQVDPETGRRTYRRIHWGTVDENNRFIPGKAYIFASLEERSKLIFPEGWDLSETEKIHAGLPGCSHDKVSGAAQISRCSSGEESRSFCLSEERRKSFAAFFFAERKGLIRNCFQQIFHNIYSIR